MNSLVIPSDMITIKSRLDVANIRLDSLSNNNSNDITNSRFISDIIIRDATEVDISKIKELVSEVFHTYMEQYPTVKKFMKKSISKLPHEIDNNSNNKFWVAVLKDSIIGCIGLRINSNIGEIIHTSVSSNWRGQGIGQKLLSQVIEYANKSTINSLHLSVMNFLTSAQSLYIKMGFVEDGDKNKGGNDTDCYIVHMKLNLDG
jgi:ribosomal-protein-alanine N-acetyltransferase